MDHPMPPAPPSGPSRPPIHERWELLKDIIEHQYINEKRKLPDLAQYMKDHHGFDAGVHQYKYQFKKWKLRKNVPSEAKNHIGRCLQTRAEAGRSSTAIQYQGHTVAPEKMRRYLKDRRRQDLILKGPASGVGVVANAKLAFGKNIFTRWSMPYGAFRVSGSSHLPSSPYTTAPSPYGDITMATPPSDAASPGTQFVQARMNSDVLKRVTRERAQLFVQGKHTELVKSMKRHDFQIMNEWLYQFWLFSFKSAKHWGVGPRHWTASGLRFDAFEANIPTSSQDTPRSSSSVYGASPHSISSPSTNNHRLHPEPSQLCNWVIHVSGAQNDFRPLTHTTAPKQDPHDESTWKPWDHSWKEPSFDERIRDALEHSDFSTLKSDQLPVAIPQVAKEAERSPNEMILEALSFAIMGRNVDLIDELFENIMELDLDTRPCYPFHLAASYLDGSKTCCTVFRGVIEHFGGEIPERMLVDDVGHTVMDKLLLVILKSHTTALPSVIDPTNRENRFPGDETDICGRWDADSDCYRSLLSRGVPAAPAEWKHKFCHTSANAICHVIPFVVWEREEEEEDDDDHESGLFSRLCTSCGLKLTMSELHALVLVAFHLAMSGSEDEDLFGILACALQMLDSGANPKIKRAISLELLDIGQSESMDTCTHEKLTPAELAERIGSFKISSWSKGLATGWETLCWVLQRSQEKWLPYRFHYLVLPNVDFVDGDYSYSHSHTNPRTRCCGQAHLRGDSVLGTLWAAVQTELLTYRRVNVGDPWASDNFDMVRLLWGLKETETVSVGLVEKGLMKTHCRCGGFPGRRRVCMDDVSATYFSNMDIWMRATYLSA